MALSDLPLSTNLPAELSQLRSGDYRYAERLPDGAVVVVGANGSGAEIAEDLHLAGRRVHLFTAPVSPLVRMHCLSGLGTRIPIDIGDLVRRGMRLYGALQAVEGPRMIAAAGLYLGCRATELDIYEAGVTSVIWSGEMGEELAVAA